jgi:hypothetical protein
VPGARNCHKPDHASPKVPGFARPWPISERLKNGSVREGDKTQLASDEWPKRAGDLALKKGRCRTRFVRRRNHIQYENMNNKKELSAGQREDILKILKARFEGNMNRHKGVDWARVRAKLEADAKKLWSLYEMERTGGEPDVVGFDKKAREYMFYDCSPESPTGRRSLCYDREALESRKEHKPKNSALDMAAAIDIELLTEEQYRELQKLGNFDTKTASWVKTPVDIRNLGGAIFCDRRYGRVFTYHNGAESYYAARGFRGSLRI